MSLTRTGSSARMCRGLYNTKLGMVSPSGRRPAHIRRVETSRPPDQVTGTAEVPPGLLAGRYRIERRAGRGGMATVYVAEDVRHQRRVAIKVLHPELAAAVGVERFLAEIRTAAALQHPHIVGLIDSGDAGARDSGGWGPYYGMPYGEGESLRDRPERE